MPKARALAVIDFEHLRRMTLGDEALAAEVLAKFADQSAALVQELSANPEHAGAIVHKLRGSARSVGAVALDRALDAFERAAAEAGDISLAKRELERCSRDIGLAVRASRDSGAG